MPVKKLLGDEAVTVGDRQVPTVPSAKGAIAPINTDRWYRNGKAVDASAFNDLNDHYNKAMLHRTKEAFSYFGDLGSDGGGISAVKANSAAGTSPRWRFAFHTSPYTHALLVRAVLVPPNAGYGNDTYATLKIYSDAAESSLVSTTEFHYGPGPAGAVEVGGWQYHKVIDRFIEGLSADTDYYALVTDENYGRIQSIAAADLQSMSENYSGYLPCNFTEQTPIVDEYRQNIVQLIAPLWKRGGAKVLNWSRNTQATALDSTRTTSATPTNLFDTAVTTVSASSPGYTLDMRGKNRLSQTTVPCVMKVFGRWEGAGSAGAIYLKDSGGNTVASIVDAWAGGVMSWASAVVNLPPTIDKYDLQISVGGGTPGGSAFYVWAVSLYEYET